MVTLTEKIELLSTAGSGKAKKLLAQNKIVIAPTHIATFTEKSLVIFDMFYHLYHMYC